MFVVVKRFSSISKFYTSMVLQDPASGFNPAVSSPHNEILKTSENWPNQIWTTEWHVSPFVHFINWVSPGTFFVKYRTRFSNSFQIFFCWGQRGDWSWNCSFWSNDCLDKAGILPQPTEVIHCECATDCRLIAWYRASVCTCWLIDL